MFKVLRVSEFPSSNPGNPTDRTIAIPGGRRLFISYGSKKVRHLHSENQNSPILNALNEIAPGILILVMLVDRNKEPAEWKTMQSKEGSLIAT
jgi:hypothetical protein